MSGRRKAQPFWLSARPNSYARWRRVGGKQVVTTVYNGLLMPPLLRVQPGDQVQLQLRNDAAQSANIHYHGFQVTPLGSGDNVFLDINPGYDFLL